MRIGRDVGMSAQHQALEEERMGLSSHGLVDPQSAFPGPVFHDAHAPQRVDLLRDEVGLLAQDRERAAPSRVSSLNRCEVGQRVMADAISCVGIRGVCGVLDPCEALCVGEVLDHRAWHIEEGAVARYARTLHGHLRGVSKERGEPPGARAASGVHEQGLERIVEVMTREDGAGVVGGGDLDERAPACVSRGILCALTCWGDVEVAGDVLCDVGGAPGELRAKRGVALGAGAKLVVDVRGHQRDAVLECEALA